MSEHESNSGVATQPGDSDRKGSGWRTRWAAIGAALAVAAGAGGISWAGATNAQVAPSQTYITPCRIMDTRASSQVGPRGTALASSTTHTIQVTGTNGNCTIPSDASGVTLNLTVVSPAQAGFITVFPGGSARPTASSINYSAGTLALSNLVEAGLGTTGQLSFFASAGPVNLVVDITGFTTAARLTSSQVGQMRWDKDLGRPLTLNIGNGPRGVAFDGSNIWISNSLGNTVSRVDPTTNEVVVVPVATTPRGIGFDGSSIWVTHSGSNNVLKINPRTRAVLADVPVGTAPTSAAFDGTSIWVNNSGSNDVSRINPSTNTVIATIPVGSTPRGLAFDGANIWVTNFNGNNVSKINPATNAVTATVAVGGSPNGVVFDGTSIWVANFNGNSVSKIDPTTNAVTATVSLGTGPGGIAFDGTNVWTTNSGSNNVSRIDVATNTVTATISVGAGPAGIAFDGTSIWVSNLTGNTVSRLRAG